MFVKVLENLFIDLVFLEEEKESRYGRETYSRCSFLLDCSEADTPRLFNFQKPSVWNIFHLIHRENGLQVSCLYKCLGSIVLRMHHEIKHSNLVLIRIGSCVSMCSCAMTVIIAFFMYKHNIGCMKAIDFFEHKVNDDLMNISCEWDYIMPSLISFEKDILLRA